MIINRNLTSVNYTKGSNKKNKYIVIHYTAQTGDAKNQTIYFKSVFRGASANYFVGFRGDVWQSVEDKNIAWHVGANRYVHPDCRNSNSIGIEMCVRKRDTKTMNATDKDWYFEEATVIATAELVRELMKRYNIPIENVIRHYDVTGKICPAPYVNDEESWKDFLKLCTIQSDVAESHDPSIAGIYRCNNTTFMRTGASKRKEVLAVIPAGTQLRNYGYYSINSAGNMWLYFQYEDKKGFIYLGNLSKIGG